MKTASDILRDNRIVLKSTAIGRYYAACPRCSSTRKKSNQKCLGVTIGYEDVRLGCNHCGWTGGAPYEMAKIARRADPFAFEKTRAKAEEQRNNEMKKGLQRTRWLWSQREPIAGSIAETYLRVARDYTGKLPGTLGFLPARGEYPPAMIAAFGKAVETRPGELEIYDAAVRGVHLTKLKPDGSGKADVAESKITLGVGNTAPIMLAPPNDLLGLVIAEGTEDALSAHLATGLGAWAAGTASRLPAMAEAVPAYIEAVSIMIDGDDNGERYSNELARKLYARGIEALMIRPGDAV
jgi:hypothetical protein